MTTVTPVTPPTADQLRVYKDQGMTDQGIADLHGTSEASIRYYRAKYGIRGKTRGGEIYQDHETLEERYRTSYPKAVAMREEGYSFREIGDALKVPESTVSDWLKQSKFRKRVHNPELGRDIVYQALVAYKYQHNGNTPTHITLAKSTGYSEGSTKRYINSLAEEGRIVLRRVTQSDVQIDIPGSQWIPPSGWKMPAKLPVRPRVAKPRRDKRKRLEKEGRLCDCGREATWRLGIVLGGGGGRSDGRKDALILCDDCADLEREYGADPQPITERVRQNR